MQPVDQYFDHGDARLRFRDEGEGAPVIFIHGWTLDLDAWQPQTLELRRSFRVVPLDRRGFGLSSGSPSLVDDVSDLRALIDHLQLARVAVVGMSQGARVALHFALSTPQRLSALVLDGAPNHLLACDMEAEEEVPLARYRELMRSGGLEAFRREWQEHPFMRLQTSDPDVRALLARMIARYPGRDLREPPPRSQHPIAAGSLSMLRAPVLILNGERDIDTRKQAGDALCRALPLAERELIPNAGHLANLDHPRAYNDAIRRFLVRQARIAA